jgi:Tol biopolymer transport system component
VDGPIGAFLDAGLFSISATGTLVYWSRGDVQNEPTWFDAQGKPLGKLGEPGAYRGLSLSWDGTKAFLARQNPGETSSLWLLDVSRGTSMRSEVNLASDDRPPLWAADGRSIVFEVENQPGQMNDIYEKPLGGTAAATLLMRSNEWKTPSSWSADGRFLLYTVFEGDSKNHLWVLPLGGAAKPFPLHRTEFNEYDAHFSPDGHWVAYVSDESGRSEIYVRPFLPDASGEGVSDTGDKFLISNGGGYSPAWRRDGIELYYVDRDTRLMAVSVTTNPAFQAGVPRFLFQSPTPTSGRFGRIAWAPSPDGKRFLFLVPEALGEPPFTVVLNWESLLKK